MADKKKFTLLGIFIYNVALEIEAENIEEAQTLAGHKPFEEWSCNDSELIIDNVLEDDKLVWSNDE